MKETVKCIGIIMFGESNLLDRIEKEYISCETTTEKRKYEHISNELPCCSQPPQICKEYENLLKQVSLTFGAQMKATALA